MGSVLLRDNISINDNGNTQLNDIKIPVISLNGNKDGLLRISKAAEA